MAAGVAVLSCFPAVGDSSFLSALLRARGGAGCGPRWMRCDGWEDVILNVVPGE